MNDILPKSFDACALDKNVTETLKFGLILFLFIQIALLVIFQQPLINIALIGVILIGIFYFKNSEMVFYSFIIYIAIVPTAAFKPSYYPIYTSYNIILLFIFLIIFQLLTSTKNSLERYSLPLSIADILLIFFFGWMIIAILFGFAMNPKKMILKEAEYIFLFGFFWWATKVKAHEDWIYRFAIFYVLLTTVVAIEFTVFVISAMNLESMLFHRIVTQQPFLALFAVPLLISFFIKSRKFLWKMMVLLMIILNVVAVVLSQWRALTGGIIVTVFATLLILAFRNGVTIKSWKTICKMGLIGLLFLGVLFVIMINTVVDQEMIESLFRRYESFQSVTGDASWNMRSSGIQAALQEWKVSPIIGSGFGNRFDARNFFVVYDNQLDNSYIFLLWKTGLIGIMLFFLFLGTLAVHGFRLIRNLPDSWQRYYICAIVAGFAGLLFSSYFYLSLMRYRFIIFWALFLGTIEVLYQSYKQLKISV